MTLRRSLRKLSDGARAERRFQATITVTPEGHWLWPEASLTQEGYGRIREGAWQGYAHQWAWRRWRGPLPPETRLKNLCGLKRCVNYTHWQPKPIVRRGPHARR